MERVVAFTLAALLPLVPSSALAQVGAAGTTLVVPVVASTATYTTELIVKDVSGSTRQIAMTFYEAETSATPGPKPCTPFSLNPYQARTIILATQCPIAPGSHHGFVVVQDATVPATNLFFVFARTVNFAGIGFAVDGFPIGHIGGGESFAEVIGVKRQAATPTAPAFQTNCFVGTLDDPVSYTITVWAAGGAYTINGTLQPFQMRRYLDIFASAGVPAGDYTEVSVGFTKTGGSVPNTLLAFCTVQDNTSFGADFRVAKTWNGADNSRVRRACWGTVWAANACTDTLQPWASTIMSAANQNRHMVNLYAPDTVSCALTGPRKADLELRIGRYVNGALTTFAGGNNQQSFVYSTGARSGIGGGWHTDHYLEVGFREGGNATFPIPYGVYCQSGNGTSNLIWNGTPPDDF